MGLAFGSEKCSQWWKKHFINPSELLEEKGLAVTPGRGREEGLI